MAGLKDIIGFKKQVETLKYALDTVNNPKKYVDFGTALPKGLLIYGESETGKTFMAESFLEACERQVFVFEGGGDAEKEIKRLFKRAAKNAPSVIFFDDIDRFKENDGYSEIFELIDKEICCMERGKCFFVATAESFKDAPHRLDSLDIIRTELEEPDYDDAVGLFKEFFKDKPIAEDFSVEDFCHFVADRTYNELRRVYNNAALTAVYEGSDTVTVTHLVKAELLSRDDDDELAEEFDESSAYHEAGHAAVHLLLGGEAACMVLTCNNGGYFREKGIKEENYEVLERRYVVGMAGKACEEIFKESCSIYCDTDLERTAKAVESDLKKLASKGFEFFNGTELNSPAYNDLLAKKVRCDLKNYYDRARELIENNKPLITAFVDALRVKFYLLRSEIKKIYEDYKSEYRD